MNRSIDEVQIFRTANDLTLATSQCYLIYWIISEHFGTGKYYLAAAWFVWMVQNVISRRRLKRYTILDVFVYEVADI